MRAVNISASAFSHANGELLNSGLVVTEEGVQNAFDPIDGLLYMFLF